MNTSHTYFEDIKTNLSSINPDKIIVFGSYATDNYSEDSDIDLIVVTADEFTPQTYEEKSELYLKVNKLLRSINRVVPIDLIVYTKPMYEKFIKLDSNFTREILATYKIIYERNNPAMC